MVAPVVPPAAQAHWLRASVRRLFVRSGLAVALLAVPVGVLAAGIVGWAYGWHIGVDSAVYRSGAVALLTNVPLYDNPFLTTEPWWAWLPFTYPPASALLFVPLTFFPTQVSWGLLNALSVLALALVVRIAVQNVPSRPVWMTTARTTVFVTVSALALEPVWRTLFLGQINLILMALVVVDVLVLGAVTGRARHLGGVLIGVAASVKLIPLVFIPHLWFTGRRADAVRALVTFVALQGLLYMISPYDFRQYLTVTDPERTGPTFWAGNQSLHALVMRLTDLSSSSTAIAIGLGVLLAVPAFFLARRYHRAGQPLPALLVTAFFGLLFSPVSWSHHWVWVVPLIVYLLSRLPDRIPTGWARVRTLLGVGSVVLVYASCVLLIIRTSAPAPGRPPGAKPELDWTPPEVLLGNAYLLVPLVAGVFVLTRMRRRERERDWLVSELDGVEASASPRPAKETAGQVSGASHPTQ